MPHRLFVRAAGLTLAAGLCFASAPPSLHAQQSATPGCQVQIIGFQRWNQEMLQDSLKKYFAHEAPSLCSSACGATIQKLGFPAASVMLIGGRSNVLISLVEPQDSIKVRRNAPVTTTYPLPESWKGVMDPFLTEKGYYRTNEFNRMVRLFVTGGRTVDSARTIRRADPKHMEATKDAQETLWNFLATHNRPEDLKVAAYILEHDSTTNNRVLASAVLTSFPNDTIAWGALARSLKDNKENISMAAARSLQLLAMGRDTIDWSPWAKEIRWVLGGGNLWILQDVALMVARTNVNPSLAPALLGGGNAHYVLEYAGLANLPFLNLGPRALLWKLSGEDNSKDVGKWKAWVEGLPAS